MTLQDLERLPRKDPRTAAYVLRISNRLTAVLESAWDDHSRNDTQAVEDAKKELTQIVGPNDSRHSQVEAILESYTSQATKPHPKPFVVEMISLFRTDLRASTLASYTKVKEKTGKVARLSDIHEIVDAGSSEVLLKTINVFKFLNYVDLQCESGECHGSELVKSFYASQYPSATQDTQRIPFLQLATTLVLLTPVFTAATAVSNAEWERLGLTIENGQLETYQPLDKAYERATVRDVIDSVAAACRGIRYRSKMRVGAVGVRCSSESGAIAFTSTKAVVVFNNAGFVSFLFGLLRAVQHLIQEEGLPKPGVAQPSPHCT